MLILWLSFRFLNFKKYGARFNLMMKNVIFVLSFSCFFFFS
jgi:hypothetical protein